METHYGLDSGTHFGILGWTVWDSLWIGQCGTHFELDSVGTHYGLDSGTHFGTLG